MEVGIDVEDELGARDTVARLEREDLGQVLSMEARALGRGGGELRLVVVAREKADEDRARLL